MIIDLKLGLSRELLTRGLGGRVDARTLGGSDWSVRSFKSQNDVEVKKIGIKICMMVPAYGEAGVLALSMVKHYQVSEE